MGDFHFARAAPGGPENDQNILAFVVAEFVLFAGDIGESEIRRRLTIPPLERAAPGLCRFDDIVEIHLRDG